MLDQFSASRRAAPMTRDDRRAAVLRATVPLLRQRGPQVSTRELAEAAGVAEGTLFRVFPDKQSLIRAALAEAMDPAPLEAALDGVDRRLPLEDRLRQTIELLSSRMAGIVQLISALPAFCGDRLADRGAAEHAARDARVLSAVAAVLEPDAPRLRVSPLEAAALVRGVVVGQHMPGLPLAARLPAGEIAACLVHGLLPREES
jgi:AcrR family transcriptional regulator